MCGLFRTLLLAYRLSIKGANLNTFCKILNLDKSIYLID